MFRPSGHYDAPIGLAVSDVIGITEAELNCKTLSSNNAMDS
jgi:hypothetical protein